MSSCNNEKVLGRVTSYVLAYLVIPSHKFFIVQPYEGHMSCLVAKPLQYTHFLHRISLKRLTQICCSDSDKGTVVHLTYAALEAKANQIARRISQILENGNRKQANNDGDYVITVCMEPSEKLIVTLLAVWKVGAAYLPLDVNTPVNRMEHIFREVNPLMMITDHNGE